MDSSVLERYLASLTPKQYKAYTIAKDHLNDSFDLEKSNGFLAWVKKNHISLDSATTGSSGDVVKGSG
jgi:hypothetical protein